MSVRVECTPAGHDGPARARGCRRLARGTPRRKRYRGVELPRGVAAGEFTADFWPFVQRQDSGLWIREWWFESTRANPGTPARPRAPDANAPKPLAFGGELDC